MEHNQNNKLCTVKMRTQGKPLCYTNITQLMNTSMNIKVRIAQNLTTKLNQTLRQNVDFVRPVIYNYWGWGLNSFSRAKFHLQLCSVVLNNSGRCSVLIAILLPKKYFYFTVNYRD